MCLELVGSAVTLDQEGGVVLVLLGSAHLLTTDHLIQVDEAVCVCVCVRVCACVCVCVCV